MVDESNNPPSGAAGGELEGLVSSDGSFNENWLDAKVKGEEGSEVDLFDEDVRNDQLTKSFKNIKDLVKSHHSAQKMIGKNKIAVPSEEASDEEWDAAMKALGMPDDASGYGLVMPDDLPEEIKSPELLDWFAKTARALRLLPSQAKGLFENWNELQKANYKKQLDEFNLSLEKGMNSLKGRLGAAFNEKMEACDAIINAATDGLDSADDLRERLENDVRRDPRVAQVFIRLGEMIGEDRLGHIEKQNLFAVRPSEALAQIEEIKADPAYLNENAPKHKALVDKMTILHKIAYPK